jgi:hypothetical protein
MLFPRPTCAQGDEKLVQLRERLGHPTLGTGLNTDPMGNPGLARIFAGANGIRAGWRLLVFAAIIVALLFGKLCLYGMLHVHAPSTDDKLISPGYDAANAAIGD